MQPDIWYFMFQLAWHWCHVSSTDTRKRMQRPLLCYVKLHKYSLICCCYDTIYSFPCRMYSVLQSFTLVPETHASTHSHWRVTKYQGGNPNSGLCWRSFMQVMHGLMYVMSIATIGQGLRHLSHSHSDVLDQLVLKTMTLTASTSLLQHSKRPARGLQLWLGDQYSR